jgi:hypothetical protein
MRLSAALLVVLLVGSSVAGVGAGLSADRAHTSRVVSDHPAVAGSPAATGPVSATTTSVNDTESNATVRDGTDMYVSIRESGNARWNVTARFVLRDDNETEAFRELAENYENGDTNIGFTRKTFERVVERVDADSDRSMEIRNSSRSAHLRDNGSVGLLSFSFTWRNFTQVAENRVVLGDAFWIESETWLPALTDDQTLTIEGPPDHYILRTNVSHNGIRTNYEGPRNFERGDFSITYSPRSPETETPTPSNFPDLSNTPGLLVLMLLFGSGIIGVYAWSQRRDTDTDSDERTDEPRNPSPVSSVTDEAGTDNEANDADEGNEQDMELLSDDERVLRLLRENDGRMKQGQIVKETNWSNAKVSQLLSKMSENDEIDKLRIGRENLITLPEEDVADVD